MAVIEKDEDLPYLLRIYSEHSIENEKVAIGGYINKAANISRSFYDLIFSLKILLKRVGIILKSHHCVFGIKNEKEMSPEEMSVFL